MKLSEITLETVKDYLRIDHNLTMRLDIKRALGEALTALVVTA